MISSILDRARSSATTAAGSAEQRPDEPGPRALQRQRPPDQSLGGAVGGELADGHELTPGAGGERRGDDDPGRRQGDRTGDPAPGQRTG